MHPVELAGERILLREFAESDVDQAVSIVGDERVTQWLSFNARTRDETATMLRGVVERAKASPRTEYYLAVTLIESAKLIGFARLGLDGVRAGKLGYAIHPAHWEHGYAGEAASTLITFGFARLDLHRISAAIGPDNLSSTRVIERLGFTREGRIRDHVHTNGAWRDSVLYSMLAEEWAGSVGTGQGRAIGVAS